MCFHRITYQEYVECRSINMLKIMCPDKENRNFGTVLGPRQKWWTGYGDRLLEAYVKLHGNPYIPINIITKHYVKSLYWHESRHLSDVLGTLTRSIQRRLDNTSMEMQEEMYALDRVILDLYSIITFLKIWLKEGNESQVCEWDEHEYTMLPALSILLPPSWDFICLVGRYLPSSFSELLLGANSLSNLYLAGKLWQLEVKQRRSNIVSLLCGLKKILRKGGTE